MIWLKELLKEREDADELVKLIGSEVEKRYGMGARRSNEYEKEIAMLRGEIASVRKEHAIEKEIMAQGGRNAKAVRALMEENMVETDAEGRIVRIDLDKIKKSDPYLFKEIKNVMEGSPQDKSSRRKSERNVFFESARRAAGIKG